LRRLIFIPLCGEQVSDMYTISGRIKMLYILTCILKEEETKYLEL
jgi:hypothetical protein